MAPIPPAGLTYVLSISRWIRAIVDSDEEVEDTPNQTQNNGTQGGAAGVDAGMEDEEVRLETNRRKAAAFVDSEESGDNGAVSPVGKRVSRRATRGSPDSKATEGDISASVSGKGSPIKGGGKRRVVRRDDDATGSDSDSASVERDAAERETSPAAPLTMAQKRAEMEQIAALARNRAKKNESPKTKRQIDKEKSSEKDGSKKKEKGKSKGGEKREKLGKKGRKDAGETSRRGDKGSEKKKKKKDTDKSKAAKSGIGKGEKDPADAVKELMTKHLTKIISKAVLEKDQTLTKRVCRERLAEVFADKVEEHKAFVNEEVGRIVGICNSMEEPALSAMLEAHDYVTKEEVDGVHAKLGEEAFEAAAEASSESESDSASSVGSESGSESDSDAPSRKKVGKKGPARVRSGLFLNIVAVPAGKKMLKNVNALRDLIEMHGGRLQQAVTRKVTHVVVSRKQESIGSSDPRVKSARKHGAKIVFDSFFEVSARDDVLANPAEFSPDIGASKGKDAGEKSKAKDKNRTEERAASGDESDGDSEGGSPRPKKRRVQKPRVESEWDREFRMRFGYAKEARTRPFSFKDTVVPDATFFEDSNGQVLNVYLTQTETLEDADGEHSEKFYAIKMVEAGGLMKGEKWHLVCQWGRVGAQKPGCEVVDYSDSSGCMAAFAKRFFEKTRNSWEAGPFAFRTVPGKFSLVDHSDGEGDSDSEGEAEGAGAEEAESMLDETVQGLVMGMLGKHAISDEARALDVDLDKLPLRKLKRHRVHEALAELSSIQGILQKGAKQTGNDVKRLGAHRDRVMTIIPQEKGAEKTIETVEELQTETAKLEDLGELCVTSALRKRVMAMQQPEAEGERRRNKIDALYRSLNTQITPLTDMHADSGRIREMVSGSHAAQHDGYTLKVERVFEIKRAGDEARYAPFRRLPNKMMLWKGGRTSCQAALLSQGLHVPLHEAPSAGYVFGKGVYLHDCVSEAARACALTAGNKPCHS